MTVTRTDEFSAPARFPPPRARSDRDRGTSAFPRPAPRRWGWASPRRPGSPGRTGRGLSSASTARGTATHPGRRRWRSSPGAAALSARSRRCWPASGDRTANAGPAGHGRARPRPRPCTWATTRRRRLPRHRAL